MALAVFAVAAIAYWDARREASAALEDFANAQVALANGLADPIAPQLEISDGAQPPAALAVGLHRVERPGHLELFLAKSGEGVLTRANGSAIRSPVIEEAVVRGDTWVRLSREQASALDLPARTAIAGLARVAGHPDWTIVVAATAQEERDREVRAQWRLVLSVLVASGLVLAFGGLALRNQRKELELTRGLAVAEAERVRDERLVRADKLATMGALATGIAHEVSTPLGVIVGRAEQLLPKVGNDERARRAVDAILEQGERIGRVIRGFLALARGEAPAFDHVDPASIARASVDLVEHRFAKAGVSLQAHMDGPVSEIACEPRLLEQAVANLLLNACDACEPGGQVSLSVEGDPGRVAFIVNDNGAGIPPGLAARVGEPFFTTKPVGQGTGLGLAITNEIVKHHRGNLTIGPRAHAAGTRASIEIPTACTRDYEHAPLLH